MDLRQLRYFRAVAEELHFGRASEKLHVAQPALSRQIQTLESDLKVLLFDRSRRRVQLTEAGRILLEEAKRLLSQSEQMVQTVQRAARGEIGRLTIAFVGSAMYGPLPATLRAFRSRFPGVHLLLDEMETSLQRQALLERRIDVGLLRAPLRDAEICSDVLLTEPIIVALPNGHPLVKKTELKLASLADQAFVHFPHGLEPSYADIVMDACIAAGFRPRGAQETTEMQTAISLVSAGFGICLVPAAVRRLRRPGVVYRPLTAPAPTIQLIAAYHRDNRNPAVVEFLRTIHP